MIAVSSEIKEQLVRRGAAPDHVVVILNSIDPSAFRRDDALREPVRRELGLGAEDVVIGAVGRLERQKRFDLLLEVFAALAKTRRLRLVIVGDGSLRGPLAAQAAALGLGDRCVLTGHRDDIARLHDAFDLFVQSSEYEGTPNAVLEAMAMETPLVATDVGGTCELVQDGVHGLVVPPHDTGALERAIAAALDDPAAARTRATSARRRIETDLSFEARTRKLEAIYDELAAGRA